MNIFFKNFLLISLLFGDSGLFAITGGKLPCTELGLYFTLPAGFNSLDSLQLDRLGKRGEKAVNETFKKETLQGWQPGCLNLQDSFKRTILMAVITKEAAIRQDGSTENFIDKTFRDGNDFIVQRFKSKLKIDLAENVTAKQTEITIANLKVRKNAFTIMYEGRLLFFARYYFFQKNEKLYLLSFLGSPKADDNEEIVKAIENAKALLQN